MGSALLNILYKELKSSEKMGLINRRPHNFNRPRFNPSHRRDSDGDGMPDGWEYCYWYTRDSTCKFTTLVAKPNNPPDVDHDPDRRLVDRDILDTPAIQGVWEDRSFSPFQGISSLEKANSLYFIILWNTEMDRLNPIPTQTP